MSKPELEPSPIHQLASDVVDQIAAGEVVDRPAHLVKELVENSIDAGASRIEVEFDQGGRRVRVTDDGRGIRAADLPLALARHATSKISTSDDLWNLRSFGFRGEALASIAAVSRLTLISRTAGESSASQVRSEFGRLSEVAPVGGNFGTTVAVEELFANVPARLKFMKSEGAEMAQIKAALRALALANEGVEFRLKSKGKLDSVWLTAGSFLERARQVMSAEKLFSSNYDLDDYRAEVIFASPHEVVGNSRSILLFVQKRWVQDRGLQAAVIDAYRGLLMHGEFPIVSVRLDVPSGEVDVNIHPTKSQVKFRDNQIAFRAVHRALRSGLESAPWLERGAAPALHESAGHSADAVREAVESHARAKLSVSDFTRPYDGPSARVSESSEPSFASAPPLSTARFEAPEFNTVVMRQKQDFAQSAAPSSEPARTETVGPWSRLQVLGQAHLTYILAQDESRLVLIDQHAAHERVAYERLMRAWHGGASIVSQTLLLPIVVDVEPDGAEALMHIADDLEKVGVIVDQVGPQSIALRSRPAMISEEAIRQALIALAREMAERGGSFVLEKKIGDLFATMACHSVVRAGQALSVDQMKSLLKQMDEFPLSSFCPHGRPVSVDYPFHQVERDFGRIV